VKAGISARLKETGVFGVRVPPFAISVRFRLLSYLCAVLASFFVLAYTALVPLVGSAAFSVARHSALLYVRVQFSML
jgi:hypothetical protein